MNAFFLAIGASAFLIAGCGSAFHSGTPWANEIQGSVVDAWISSEGRVVPIYYHDGYNYLLGREGDRYSICLRNRIDLRVEAVVSVDGRDVVSGRVADYEQDRGYVLSPGEEVCIEGFRRSLNEVAAFQFTRPDEAYAARMGDADNVGVIGIALFDEVSGPPPVAIASEEPERAGAPADSATALESDYSARARRPEGEERGLGTGYGRGVYSDAEIVPFERRNPQNPQELVVLYYDDREGLEQIGIVFADDPDQSSKPNPFPGIRSRGTGFAPPPPR